MKKYNNINEYISNYSTSIQSKLQKIRSIIHIVAPSAVEKISYGIPTFDLYGNLVHFAGYESHIGFYPGASAVLKFRKELAPYRTSKGTIQFDMKESLPIELIKKIVKFRFDENIAQFQERSMKQKRLHIEFHKTGTVLAKGKMANGKLDGYWEWFRKDGSIMRSGTFKNGEQVGTWTTYDRNGKVYKTSIMKKNDIAITDLPKIGAPATRALANVNIKNLRDLSKWSEQKLLLLHGIGLSTIPILKKALVKKNLSFAKK